MKKEKILFFYPNPSTFINKDLDFLKIHFFLKTHSFNPKKKIYTVYFFLNQLFFLFSNIKNTRLIICKFVGYHSFLPALFGNLFNVPVLFIMGGTEAHYFPENHHGSFTNPLLSLFMKASYKLADHLSPVHESLEICDYTYDKSGKPKQGAKYFCPWINIPFTTIYYGFDQQKFYYTGKQRIKNSFITIAINFDGSEFIRKGIDLIFEAAEHYPSFNFTIIGTTSRIFEKLPSNITIIPFVPNEQLKDYLSEHEFYLQLSTAEGFPNALCEAMLCECIPIGSDVFGIPLIMGDTGFLLMKRKSKMLFELLNQAIVSDKEVLSKKARERIINNFPMERREKELLKLVSNLINRKN
jgi:glycosyltransferase involved in cell wall biosynthesis